MSTYADTIAASRRAAEQRLALENAEAMEKSRARDRAQEFLKSVVTPELEQARQDLAAAGVTAELASDTDDGTSRCSLTIQYPRGGTGVLIFAAAAGINAQGVEPSIVFKKGEQYDGTDLELSREAVVEKIRVSLSDLF